MEGLIASGRVVDLILVLVIVEAVGLIAYRRATGRGIAPGDLLANLFAGAFLLLALRAVLTGSGWGWTALFLAAALVAHLADLARRWR